MPLKIPSLFDKKSAYDFLNDFLTTNAQMRGFSQRSISQKLGWPVSYLPDLMKRRKAFTVKRAVEFGNYFQLNPIDFEKLIYLALSDSGLIGGKDIQKIADTRSPQRKSPTKDLDLLSATHFIVFEAIRWLHGKATMEILCQIAAKREIQASAVQESVLILIEKNRIEKRGREYRALAKFLFSDDDGVIGIESHQQFMQLQANFFAEPFGPATFHSAIVHIETSRFDEIQDRVTAFRNWLFEISKADSEKPMSADVRLFQLDMNLTPILDKDMTQKLRKICKN